MTQANAEQRKAAHLQRVEQEKTFQASLSIPDWALGAIVATYTVFDEDNSAPYADDYRFNTEKTIILAWSKHTRRLFPELRKVRFWREDNKAVYVPLSELAQTVQA